MKYFVSVKSRAKKCEVIQIDLTHFKISVKEPPFDNRANEAVQGALADHLDIAKSRLLLINGARSRNKTFVIE